jgi:hypothetical protein
MTPGVAEVAIATWFVADKPGEETHFPQLGGLSSSAEFQNNYWRCITCFFDSSLRHNAGAPHLLFANTDPPIVDGVDLAELFRSWDVKTVHLPLTFRLPRGTTKSWGNQFYILDIIKHVAANKVSDKIIVLDCDCVWMKPVNEISEAISRYGCLTYTLNDEHYAWDAPINGVTRQEMAKALRSWTSNCGIHADPEAQNTPFIHYHGGEIFAATQEVCGDLAALVDSLWQWSLKAGSEDRGLKEEAHFLSILYASRSFSNYTANAFLKRIWTTFHLSNAEEADFDLVIWHLPAEKMAGFRRLFRQLTGMRREFWAKMSLEDYREKIARTFGIPRRGAMKLARDILTKLKEKGGRIIKSRATSIR